MDEIPQELITEFNAERTKEDQRLSRLEKVRISPHNPRSTMRWDIERCDKRLENLKAWTETWWRAKGYQVVWNNDAIGRQLSSATLITFPQKNLGETKAETLTEASSNVVASGKIEVSRN